jgi:hypothetical protein
MSKEQEIGKSLSSLLQETLSASFSYQSENIHTAIPCIVLAVRDNLNGMMVDIQPTINQKLEDGTTAERPQVLGVPVQFPCSKSAGFTFPIKVGDSGLAIFSMRNLDSWKSGNGRPAVPMNNAKFDKGDAIFIPGIQPPSVSINNPAKRTWPHDTNDAVLVNNIGTGNEVEIRLKANGDCIINTNQNVEVNCENLTANVNTRAEVYALDILVDASNSIELTTNTMQVTAPGGTTWIGDITMTGNLIQTGAYTLTGAATFNGIPFDTHKHLNVQPGVGTSGGPTN